MQLCAWMRRSLALRRRCSMKHVSCMGLGVSLWRGLASCCVFWSLPLAPKGAMYCCAVSVCLATPCCAPGYSDRMELFMFIARLRLRFVKVTCIPAGRVALPGHNRCSWIPLRRRRATMLVVLVRPTAFAIQRRSLGHVCAVLSGILAHLDSRLLAEVGGSKKSRTPCRTGGGVYNLFPHRSC